MRGQTEIGALKGALDEAMRGAAWERVGRPERCDILARAIFRVFTPQNGRQPPSLAALSTILARSERDQRIRSLSRAGLSNAIVAYRFGLSVRQIRRVLRGG